ncbi:SusD/RagB family nutrient-binding outer membrane lipoprotein [Arenibacter latericius]|uniref:SusD/RagB family nutrient-binding outer membrane lipoprotein n=1 Tax=Arenibacter latericius TaxID=86104 RepID=UPI000409FD4B|nr:SusD/RagB family nutrient-binding outer membrane lipoprotein [Arenibacter latericius]MDX1363773.1 SusD/RagB family nutrient-binding outer membrane lipoprotein [Arenibacter latericius]
MKKIPFIKSTILLLSILVGAVSCSDYLDVNDNPNDPPISTPQLTLPVAQASLANLNARSMTYLGQFMAYNWATPSNWSANADFARYNVTTNFFSTIFETSYVDIFKNLTYIETYEDPAGAIDYSAYKVISATLKGFQYQYLVDLYGDVPYTEANQRGANTTPKYDDAETVYKANIDALTQAANLALNMPEGAEDPGSQDIIFGGHMDEWAAFANTIKLRMLVRLSNTGQDSYIKDQIALINANGAGYIQSDVNANPGYSDASDKQSPFYGYFRNVNTNSQTDRGDFTVASDYALDFLVDTNDDRLSRIYAPAQSGGAFKGAPQSTVLPGSGFTSNDLSKVGPGLLRSADQDQPIMLLTESLLLQAEAIVRGYIPGGDAAAKELYQEAITESYVYLGVEDPEDSAESYYTQDLINVNWDSSTDKIEAIITQKWVALNSTSSIELWIEKTRTGFPADLPIPVESDGVRPVRLLYPASEVARNKDNVPTQNVGDAFTSNPFWK